MVIWVCLKTTKRSWNLRIEPTLHATHLCSPIQKAIKTCWCLRMARSEEELQQANTYKELWLQLSDHSRVKSSLMNLWVLQGLVVTTLKTWWALQDTARIPLWELNRVWKMFCHLLPKLIDWRVVHKTQRFQDSSVRWKKHILSRHRLSVVLATATR